MLSHVQLFVTPWAAAYGAPLPMESSRQEYWNGILESLSPGDLPLPGIESTSLASSPLAGGLFTSWATGEALQETDYLKFYGTIFWEAQ